MTSRASDPTFDGDPTVTRAAPAATTATIDGAALARLGTIPVRARVIVQGALSGLHRAAHRGSSIEFAEHKPYSPGDEIRHIDWKAYAKQGRYFVKQFDQESQLSVYVVLDASASMNFDGGGASKLDYAATLLASLAYLVGQQQDKIGVVVYGKTIDMLPATGRSTVRDALRMLEQAATQRGDGDGDAAAALGKVLELNRRHRSLVVLASDLFDASDRSLPAIAKLRSAGHDVSVMHTLAPYEQTFPYDGMTLFTALESKHTLLANPAAIRAEYLRKMASFIQTTKTRLTAAGVDYHLVTTGTPVEESLRLLLLARTALWRSRGGAK